MSTKIMYIAALDLAIILLTGCAADRHAQELSKETLIQVIEYDDAIQNMSRVLKDDYAKRRAIFQKAVIQGASAGISAEIDRIAVDKVDQVVLHGFAVSDLRRFISEAQDARRHQEARVQTAWASFDGKQQSILAKTKANQDELKALKSALERLQTPASTEEELERLLPLFEAAYEAEKAKGLPK